MTRGRSRQSTVNMGRAAVLIAVLVSMAGSAAAQSTLSGERIAIARSAGKITVDGDLGDEGWRNATKIEKWYEASPGDNTEPKVKNVGYLTYDERFFYAAFEFDDPNPSSIKAPFADRDNIGNGYNDYGGVILDTRNTGRTGTLFVVTPRNVQYDSVLDDASGEDAAPDFFWDSAARINDHGWTLEIRIPFSSLRYQNTNPQTWGILLYRNYPRDRHFQFFSAKLPRDSNCFICRSNSLTGLERLPSGGHLVAAPYVSASADAHPRDDIGSPLVSEKMKPQAGLDVKYTPDADNALDVTINPDFSQVESDTAQISANERFALFFPEKRPFFLEGADLFQTPIQAVYTRTITDPDWGGRVTGKVAGVRYTVLAAEDAGGGSVIIPGPNDSSLANQEFGATDFVARLKREVGLSFVGLIATARDAHASKDAPNAGQDNGNNRVIGPDFQWRPNGRNAISGQWLYSSSRTPNRPDLADEWTGQHLSGHAAHLHWEHSSKHADWFGAYQDVGDGFRADNGFVPQVGYRQGRGFLGWQVHPKGFVSRERTFLNVDYQYDRSGQLISRNVMPGLGMDIPRDGFLQFRYQDEQARAGDVVLAQRRIGYVAQFSPTRWLSQISLDGLSGGAIDFDNVRPGHGSTINFNARLNPTQHLELALLENLRWLDVDTPAARGQRLFTARVSRIRATYTFTSRLFVRGIGQYVSTDRDPSLYISDTTAHSGEFTSSVLLSYKVNWQSVMFIGYGDARELTDENHLAPSNRQFFVKLSYAFQR